MLRYSYTQATRYTDITGTKVYTTKDGQAFPQHVIYSPQADSHIPSVRVSYYNNVDEFNCAMHVASVYYRQSKAGYTPTVPHFPLWESLLEDFQRLYESRDEPVTLHELGNVMIKHTNTLYASKESLKRHFDTHIYREEYYGAAMRHARDNMGYMHLLLEQMYAEDSLFVQENLHRFAHLEFFFTAFGPGGFFNHETGDIVMQVFEDGTFKRPKPFFHTAIHESTHIAVQPLVEEFRLSNYEKETLVDFLCMHNIFAGLKKSHPDVARHPDFQYAYQRIYHTPEMVGMLEQYFDHGSRSFTQPLRDVLARYVEPTCEEREQQPEALFIRQSRGLGNAFYSIFRPVPERWPIGVERPASPDMLSVRRGEVMHVPCSVTIEPPALSFAERVLQSRKDTVRTR